MIKLIKCPSYLLKGNEQCAQQAFLVLDMWIFL